MAEVPKKSTDRQQSTSLSNGQRASADMNQASADKDGGESLAPYEVRIRELKRKQQASRQRKSGKKTPLSSISSAASG